MSNERSKDCLKKDALLFGLLHILDINLDFVFISWCILKIWSWLSVVGLVCMGVEIRMMDGLLCVVLEN